MSLYVPDKFGRIKSMVGVTAITTIQSVVCDDDNVTILCMSGNLWLNPIGTAVADATAIKLTAGMSIQLNVFKTLSLISDASGATYQVIRWVS